MSDPYAIILGMYDKWNKYTHVCQTCDALIEYTSKRVVREITCECGGKCNWVSQEPATIVDTNNVTKYTFVCDPNLCDTLIEVTCPSGFDFPNGTISMKCPCGKNMSYISATIKPTNERQQMEIVTNDEQVNALQTRITNLELMIESYQRQLSSSSEKYNELRSQLNQIIDNMTYDYWYNPNTEPSTILSDICDIIGYEPKREVSFTAVMHFSGRIDVPLSDWDTFDLTEVLSDSYVDINHGDVVIDDYELTEADEA